MDRYDLKDYIYDTWEELGIYDDEERDEDEIQEEIFNNLGYLDGINTEISYIVKYQDTFKDKLNDLLVELETYKNAFKKADKTIRLIFDWVHDNYGIQEMENPSYDLVGLGMYLVEELENDKSK